MVHDCVKEVDEGETFGAFFLANFYDSKYCLKEVYLSDNSSGTNTIQAEPGHPVRVALTFGKTFIKFIVSVEDPEEPIPVMNAADVLMESSRRHAQVARRENSPQLPQMISPERSTRSTSSQAKRKN